MSSTKMNIPKIINVGYSKRNDTYTGKLSYVIYFDEKGKLRKEKSWNSWRDKKIPNDKFDNIPTEGFVLNKGVGGQRHSYGWNARNEYIRVYDPRDFEFEISVANLLFILQECNSIKGKGLEGQFVYAWNGTELVLLPCSSYEYRECIKYTKNLNSKVTKDQMVEGHIYQMKDMTNVMYLGRHEWFDYERHYERGINYTKLKSKGNKHIFLDLKPEDGYSKYKIENGFTKLGKVISDEVSPDYANAYEQLVNSVNCLLPNKVRMKKIKIKASDLKYDTKMVFTKKGDDYFLTYISSSYSYYNRDKYISTSKIKSDFTVENGFIEDLIDLIDLVVPNYNSYNYNKVIPNRNTIVEEFDINKITSTDYYELLLVNDKNKTFKIF